MKWANLAIVKAVALSGLIYLLVFLLSSVIYGAYKLGTSGGRIPALFMSACYIVPAIVAAKKTAKKIRNHHTIPEDHERFRRFVIDNKDMLVYTLILFAFCAFLYRIVPIETMTSSNIYYIYLPLFLSKALIEPIAQFSYYSAFSLGSIFWIVPWAIELAAVYAFMLIGKKVKLYLMEKAYFR